MNKTNAISELTTFLESWDFTLDELSFFKDECSSDNSLTEEQFLEVLKDYAIKSSVDPQPHYVILWVNQDDYTLEIHYYNTPDAVNQLSHEIEEGIDNYIQFPNYPNIYLLIY